MSSAERFASAAAYIPIAGRIILWFIPARRSPYVRFHMFQSLLYTTGSTALALALGLFRCLFCLVKVFAVADVLILGSLAVMTLLARPLSLPGIGRLARRLARI